MPSGCPWKRATCSTGSRRAPNAPRRPDRQARLPRGPGAIPAHRRGWVPGERAESHAAPIKGPGPARRRSVVLGRARERNAMNLLLVTAALALGAADKPAAKAAGVDGKWLIVYAEEGGRPNNAWEARQATGSGGTITYEGAGGKKRTLHLELKGHQTAEATLGDGKEGADADPDTGHAWQGVYILSQDYLCISLSKGGGKKPDRAGAAAGASHSSGDFILIL